MAARGWRWRSTSVLAASLSSDPGPLEGPHQDQLEALLAELRTLLPSLPAAGQGDLRSACLAALRVVDRNLLAALQEAADAALASLELLEDKRTPQEVQMALGMVAKKMVHFLKVALDR